MMGATNGAGNAYTSGASEFTPVLVGVRVARLILLNFVVEFEE
jgi:hypothetical protein